MPAKLSQLRSFSGMTNRLTPFGLYKAVLIGLKAANKRIPHAKLVKSKNFTIETSYSKKISSDLFLVELSLSLLLNNQIILTRFMMT